MLHVSNLINQFYYYLIAEIYFGPPKLSDALGGGFITFLRSFSKNEMNCQIRNNEVSNFCDSNKVDF